MIKGPLAAQLMNFSSQVGFILAKGQFKDLTDSDLIDLLDEASSLLYVASEEPSFSDQKDLLMWESRSARSFLQTLFGNGQTVVKGEDKQEVMKKAQHWYDRIYKLIVNNRFSTLSRDSVEKLFPKNLMDKIDGETLDDIQDSIWCLTYSLPTPAAMILYRVAESELRKYAKRVTGESKDRWDENVSRLMESKKSDKSIVKEFDWLRIKRNEAEHPDKRYKQEEAEEILHRLSGLVKAIYA